MGDVTFPIEQDAKIRVDKISIFNYGAKQIEWLITTRTVNADGSLGQSVHTEIQQVPVDMALVSMAPPEGTMAEIAPGFSVSVGGVPGALVYAWLQWYGEQLCQSRRDAIARAVKGVKAPAPETPPIEDTSPVGDDVPPTEPTP